MSQLKHSAFNRQAAEYISKCFVVVEFSFRTQSVVRVIDE